MMKKTLLILLAVAFQGAVAGDRLPAEGEGTLRQATDQFMERVSGPRLAEAVDDVLDGFWFDRSDLAKTKATTKAQFEPELAKAENALGKPLPKAYEFLGIRRIGKSTVRFVYLQKYENFFSPWSFTFYKAKDAFKLVCINFGDSVYDDVRSFTTTEPAR